MIKYTNLKNFRILDFFQVATNISAHLGKYDLAKLKLQDAASDFRDALATLDDALKPLRASADTQQITALDARRDRALIGFSAFLKSFGHSPVAAKAEAAAKLRAHLEKYGKSPQLLPLREETAMITNLLQDMATPESAGYIKDLGAGEWIAELQEANGAFEAAYNSRTQEIALVEVGKTKAARVETQAKLTRLIELINARMTLEEDKPEYRALADEIDTEIRQAKVLYKAKPKDEAPKL